MPNKSYDARLKTSQALLSEWLLSCTRGKKLSRNTIAVGIVVFDHLRKQCPVSREAVISDGGELKGARSGLGAILTKYSVPAAYLKEATTRQSHQDGQRLFESFDWGNKLADLPAEQRNELLLSLIDTLAQQAHDWLNRQNMRLDLDRHEGPTAWITAIVESARTHSGGVVEQHLVGAKLQRRFPDKEISNHAAHTADVQTSRTGDFAIDKLVYHVTAAPGPNVIAKCAANIKAGLHPILLIPNDQAARAKVHAQEAKIDRMMTIYSIEDFVAQNIIEMAATEGRDLYSVLVDIIELYNQRLAQVETDLSLTIQLR